jgi:topoisomerase IA-like protein
MENIKLGYLGKHNDTSIYLNMGKYGFYLNYDEKLFSVPQCFQDKKFNLETAIKIIEYKSKLIKEEEKIKTDSSKDDIMTKINAATDIIDLKNIVQDIKNKKSLKKTSNE